MSPTVRNRVDLAIPPLAAALLGLAVVQIAYRTEPIVPLALVGGAALAALSLWRPMYTLIAAIALAPMELLSFQLGAVGITPTEALLAAAGISWAAGRLLDGEAPWVPSTVSWPMAALVLAVVPGIAIADSPFGVVKVFVLWTAYFFVCQMVIEQASRKMVRILLLVLALSAAVVGIMAVVKSGGTAPELVGAGDTAVGRASGSFGHPNTLATFEALALPGALALGLAGPVKLRPLALGAFALIFAGLALSLSRGGLLAVGGALVMMLAWAPFRRTVIVTGVIVTVLAISAGNPLGDTQQGQVLSQRLESVGYSAGGVDPRFRVWEVTPHIIADHPIIGIGANSFPDVAARYGLLLGNSAATYQHAHNIALTITTELGLIGLAALTWLVVALVLVLIAAYRAVPTDRGPPVALAAAFTALALQGMVDYPLRSAAIVGLVFALSGCAVVLTRREGEAGPSRTPA